MDTQVMQHVKNDPALHEMIVKNQRKKTIFYGIHRAIMYSLSREKNLEESDRLLIKIQIDANILGLINEDSRYKKIYQENLIEINEIMAQVSELSKEKLIEYLDIFMYRNVIADIVVINMNNV